MLPSELFANLASKLFVVQILNDRGRVMSFGSGVVVMAGHVVTNKHVIEGAVAIRSSAEMRTTPRYPALDYLRAAWHTLCGAG